MEGLPSVMAAPLKNIKNVMAPASARCCIYCLCGKALQCNQMEMRPVPVACVTVNVDLRVPFKAGMGLAICRRIPAFYLTNLYRPMGITVRNQHVNVSHSVLYACPLPATKN